MSSPEFDPGEVIAKPQMAGLSATEVHARVLRAQVNTQMRSSTRSVVEIFRANVFTRFNALLGALLIVILAAGHTRDALFGIVLVSNATIGIVQELRAKWTLDRLSLLNAASARVIRDERQVEIPTTEIVVDDIIELAAGDQVVVDAIVVSGNTEIDESLISGESEPISKTVGDELLSGSIVVAGSGYARALRVGPGAYAESIAVEARQFALVRSELRAGINEILRVVTWVIVPTGVLLVISQLRSVGLRSAVGGSVAGIGSMVPEGLVLLTSIAFAVAVVRLARQRVLVQELAAVEVLARVDVICVDKTGTLTEDDMVVADVEILTSRDIQHVTSALGALAAVDPNPNASMRAIASAYPSPQWRAGSQIPFSSLRKWSGASFEENGTWIIGAPEILLADRPQGAVLERVGVRATSGERVLLLARATQSLSSIDTTLPTDLEPIALLALTEQIKPDAASTLSFFAEQGVAVKVLSGDNPATVAAVASRVGLAGTDHPIDARQLPDDAEALAESLEAHTVFGRVLPHQKRAMISALQSHGHVVAMTGDGVNDALAVKTADLGVAMASGSAATRGVAQLILLDNRFSALPGVVAEGRRVIGNIERVSKLFVTKTVYATTLAILVGVLTVPFPFLPRHLTIVSSLTIGIPGFFLALAPNNQRLEPRFLRRVLSFSVPAGLVAAIATYIPYADAREFGATLAESRTMATVVLVTIGLWVLTLLGRPFTPALFALEAAMTATFVAVLALSGTRSFFDLAIPPAEVVLTAGSTTFGAVIVLEIGRWTFGEYQRDHLRDARARALSTLGFLVRRLRPGGTLGLTLTVMVVLLGSAGALLGIILQDVIAGDDSARLNFPVLRWFAEHREPGFTTAANAATHLGNAVLLLAVVIVAGTGLWLWRRSIQPPLLLCIAYLGSELMVRLVNFLTRIPRPPYALALEHFDGYSFPSGHATASAAVWGMLAAMAASSTPLIRRKIAAWMIAAVVSLAVGVARMYLGAQWLTDVLGGWALGSLWLFGVLAISRAIEDVRHPSDPPLN